MMWTELRFKMSAQAISKLMNGDTRSHAMYLRHALARARRLDGTSFDPAFFGAPDARRPAGVPGDTAISSRISHHGPVIQARGAWACDLLRERAADLQIALMNAVGSPVSLSQASGEDELHFSPARTYRVSCMVVGRPGKNQGKKNDPMGFWSKAFEEVAAQNKGAQAWDMHAEHIEKYIVNHLMRHAVYLIRCGDELGGEGALVSSIYGVCRDSSKERWQEVYELWRQKLGVKLLGVNGFTVLQQKKENRTAYYKALLGVRFSANADFVGAWHVGRLRVEGGGQLRPDIDFASAQNVLEQACSMQGEKNAVPN